METQQNLALVTDLFSWYVSHRTHCSRLKAGCRYFHSEQRLYGLVAWREAPYYTERERAALAWTETVTLIADNHVPGELYEQARQQFSEQELVNLTSEINKEI